MSMQRIRNYGSSLQVYGLRRLLEGVGEEVEVSFVDYRPGTVLTTVAEPSPTGKRAIRDQIQSAATKFSGIPAAPSDTIRYLYHRKTYGRRYFPLIDLTQEPAYNLDLDLLVIGSDEVFNFTQSSHEVGFSPDLFGYDSRAARIVSYAASFGNTTLERVQKSGMENEIREGLSRFDSISVRDENSATIVEYLIGERPEMHLDPVLSFDFMTHESRIPKARQRKRPYTLVYGYSRRFSDEENSSVLRFAKSNNSQIVCIGGIQDCCERYVDCDPFALIAYFRDAEAVITDTFHGAILAIINHRPFAAIVRPSVGGSYGNEEKLGYLLTDLGLDANRVTSSGDVEAVLERQIDYGVIDSRLEQERGRTAEFLARAVRSP